MSQADASRASQDSGRKASRCTTPLGVFVLLIAALPLSGCTPASPPGPSAVVLISIDTLRADHLGCYGYQRPTSPFLDELAAQGVVFEQAISAAPWTLPAHATLLSGLPPSTHGAVEENLAIDPSVIMGARHFRAAGFRTGGIVTHWFVSHHYGFERGFDWFHDFSKEHAQDAEVKIRADRVVDQAEEWIRAGAGEPLFLFVHLFDPHFNYDPPQSIRRQFATDYDGPRPAYQTYHHYLDDPPSEERLAHEISLYDGEIRYVDETLRRLYDLLEQTGIRERALFVITSDHGEEFLDHGSWGHAHTLYDEVIRVPLIVSGAGVAGARRVDAQVHHVDVLPTLLEAAGLPVPPELPGRSLWPALRGDAPWEASPAFAETSRFRTNLIATRGDSFKAILDLDTGRNLLFDLAADPGETNNLASAHPQHMTQRVEQTMSSAAHASSERWMLHWPEAGTVPLQGRLWTSGSFVLARANGDGEATRLGADGRTVAFHLRPGANLELAVMPVDASLGFPEAPRAGAYPVLVATGGEPMSVPDGGLLIDRKGVSLVEPSTATGGPHAVLWLQRQGAMGHDVFLDEETIRRLKSLGYVQR